MMHNDNSTESVATRSRNALRRAGQQIRDAFNYPITKRGATQHKIGDRIQVRTGQAHDAMTNGRAGTIVMISTEALGIEFDGMAGVHKWYVDDEVEVVE